MGKSSPTFGIRSQVVLALLLGSCTPLNPGVPSPPRQMRIVPEVAQTMLEIQREFEVETARCLTGFIAKGIIYIQGIEQTGGIRSQTDSTVAFAGCTSSDVVGWYHNHPESKNPDLSYCSITSNADIETLTYVHHFWVAIVSCTEDILVYRYKMDWIDYTIVWKTP